MDQPEDVGPSVQNLQVDIYLVPGLAFDLAGNRLGRGGGYYDMELAKRRPDSLTIGVTLESRIVTSIPAEPHDQPVSHIVTEAGVIGTTPTR